MRGCWACMPVGQATKFGSKTSTCLQMFLSNLDANLGFHAEDDDCQDKLLKASELEQLHVITISAQAGGLYGRYCGMLLSIATNTTYLDLFLLLTI